MEARKAQYITLKIEYNPYYSSKPSDWNWDSLLEENVEIVFSGNIFDIEDKKND
jgi:hypothetical protein